MSRKFKLEDWNGLGYKLCKKTNISINPGLTVLVGCNGSGKTTMIAQMYDNIKRAKIPCLKFDNLLDGGSKSRSEAAFYGDFSFLATSMCSSEGENIVMNMGKVAGKIGRLVTENRDASEIWLFFDAIDSGLSVDNIEDVKIQLFNTIFEDNKNKYVYIIVSCNEYEMARGENCFDVIKGEYVNINSYEDYRRAIMRSRAAKDKREEKAGN